MRGLAAVRAQLTPTRQLFIGTSLPFEEPAVTKFGHKRGRYTQVTAICGAGFRNSRENSTPNEGYRVVGNAWLRVVGESRMALASITVAARNARIRTRGRGGARLFTIPALADTGSFRGR